MAHTIEDLVKDVEAEKTVADGIGKLITGLQHQIAELKAHQPDPAAAAKIDALHQSIHANTEKLKAAVLSNTGGATVHPAPQHHSLKPPQHKK